MNKPSAASLKKVTAENLASLGVDRLAEILVEVADTRVDLKRRLRMELAAGLGPQHLAPEIDKRLTAFETSRGEVAWRQKPAFLRDLDALRGLIGRLAESEPDAATERMWRLMATEQSVSRRMRERDAAVEAVYLRAAVDLGRLLSGRDPHLTANHLVEAAKARPQAWAQWLPSVLHSVSPATAASGLDQAQAASPTAPGWALVVRHFADAAGDVAAYQASFSPATLATPDTAVAIARRHLAAGHVEEAGAALRLAAPKPKGLLGRLAVPDFDWETAWIDYLDQAGETAVAQGVRQASFRRTLDSSRAKVFIARLPDFDDVEAEADALAYAARHADFERGLGFLMAWPALAEASQMIEARPQDIDLDPEKAELWAGKLRRRFPAAAHRLLRRAAAKAFRRRDLKVSERLTQEADAIDLP